MSITTISFPSYVRLNIQSINMSDAKKSTALTVNKQLSAQCLIATGNLTSNSGYLLCQKDLFVGGKIKATMKNAYQPIQFRGRVNLTNHTVRYTITGSSSGSVSFRNIHTYQPQQYIPYGVFKEIQSKSCMRSASSGGWVGSGDLGTTYAYWDSYDQTYREDNSGVASINMSDKKQLTFTATTQHPKLLRISVFFMKHGGWIDNGLGGDFAVGVMVNGQKKYLSATTSKGTSYYRSKAMQCISATYYATTNGYFFVENQGSTIRAAFFSWNVVQLPFYYRST